MQLLSRVIGAHKLCVLGFFTYIVKYLTYHQLRIPAILVALAQSVHEFTPPDALIPVVRKLAQEFVHPGVGSEVIAAGLNSIREICRRQPWAMEEDLLGDLVEYRKSRDKGVTASARGLLQLFRDVNPGMLKRRERVRHFRLILSIHTNSVAFQGKDAAMGLAKGRQPLAFGHSSAAAVDIEGLVVRFSLVYRARGSSSSLQLLEDHLKKLREEDGHESGNEEEDDGAAWEGWDLESDSSDESSNGWIDVESDDGQLDISDSEDEKDKPAKDANRSPDAESMDVTESTITRISSLATTKVFRASQPCLRALNLSLVDPHSCRFCTP